MDTVRSSSEIERARREIAETIRARVGDLASGEGATRSSREGTVLEMPRLRDGARSLRMTSNLVGEMPPEPPTLRGRVGSWLIRSIRRALFWYTPRIVEFQQNVSRAIEQEVEAIEEIARENEALRLRIAEMETDRLAIKSSLTKEIIARRAVERWAGSEVTFLREAVRDIKAELNSLTEGAMRALESRLLAEVASTVRSVDAVAAQAAESHAALEERIRAVVDQQEADRDQWHGLLEQEAVAREAVAAGMTAGASRSDTLERRLSQRLGEMNATELAGIVRGKDHQFDAMYLTFEDQFRGRRDDIKDRLRVYLPFLEAHNIGRKGMPILDVGCGRGEWLELLRDHGLDARGVDASRSMVARCLEHKLPVTQGDAVAFLRGLAPDSVGCVSGFHIIEHLPFASLINLIDEAVRVLKPGGIVIFETPNPANVLVATERFYYDPTHRNPLPSPLMRFVAEQRGLCRVEVLELNPWPEAFHLREPGSAAAGRLDELFYGPQDYAIIGWKV
jgi:SAM-dependent methyltransferase